MEKWLPFQWSELQFWIFTNLFKVGKPINKKYQQRRRIFIFTFAPPQEWARHDKLRTEVFGPWEGDSLEDKYNISEVLRE